MVLFPLPTADLNFTTKHPDAAVFHEGHTYVNQYAPILQRWSRPGTFIFDFESAEIKNAKRVPFVEKVEDAVVLFQRNDEKSGWSPAGVYGPNIGHFAYPLNPSGVVYLINHHLGDRDSR